MTYARKKAVAFELSCSKCGADIPAPNGSLFWTPEECPQAVSCPECGASLTVPKNAAAA